MKKIYFCDTCYKPIKNTITGTENLHLTGDLILKCGSCKKGKVVIKSSEIKKPTPQKLSKASMLQSIARKPLYE